MSMVVLRVCVFAWLLCVVAVIPSSELLFYSFTGISSGQQTAKRAQQTAKQKKTKPVASKNYRAVDGNKGGSNVLNVCAGR